MARQLLLLTCYRRRKTDVRRHEMTYSRTHDRPKADPQGTGPLHIFWFSSSVPSPVRTIYAELTHGGCVLGGWAAENEPQSGSVTFPTTYFMSFDMYIFVSWYFPISQCEIFGLGYVGSALRAGTLWRSVLNFQNFNWKVLCTTDMSSSPPPAPCSDPDSRPWGTGQREARADGQVRVMDGVRVRDKLNPRDGLKVSYFCVTNYLEIKNCGFPVCHQNALLHPAVTSMYLWWPRAPFEIPVCVIETGFSDWRGYLKNSTTVLMVYYTLFWWGDSLFSSLYVSLFSLTLDFWYLNPCKWQLLKMRVFRKYSPII